MSIATEIERLLQAKADLKISIEAKGVQIAEGTKIDDYPEAVDQIQTGGGGVEYETGVFQPESEERRPFIPFANTHNEAPAIIIMSCKELNQEQNNTLIVFQYIDYYKLYKPLSWGRNWTTNIFTARMISYNPTFNTYNGVYGNSDSATDSSKNYPRYYATEAGFHPFDPSNDTTVWSPDNEYEWIAVWKPTN